MKFFVFTKRRLLIIIATLTLFLTGIGIFGKSYAKVVDVSATERKIPIYCVEKDEKKVSISFDAAWGNEQTETLLYISGYIFLPQFYAVCLCCARRAVL